MSAKRVFLVVYKLPVVKSVHVILCFVTSTRNVYKTKAFKNRLDVSFSEWFLLEPATCTAPVPSGQWRASYKKYLTFLLSLGLWCKLIRFSWHSSRFLLTVGAWVWLGVDRPSVDLSFWKVRYRKILNISKLLCNLSLKISKLTTLMWWDCCDFWNIYIFFISAIHLLAVS